MAFFFCIEPSLLITPGNPLCFRLRGAWGKVVKEADKEEPLRREVFAEKGRLKSESSCIFQVSDYVSLPQLGLITARVELVYWAGWKGIVISSKSIGRRSISRRGYRRRRTLSSGLSRTDCVSSLSSIAPGFPANLLAVSCPVSAIATDSVLANPSLGQQTVIIRIFLVFT